MITDNTAKWKAKKLSSLKTSGGIPVGFEYISMNPNVPQGSLPMFGGVYDRKVYADLWAWVQEQSGYLITDSKWQSYFKSNDGNVPFYSKGDGSTTFRVPSINCWVKGANGIEEVSSYLQAGLPILPDMSHTHTRGTMNITGTIDSSGSGGAFEVLTGAFYSTDAAKRKAASGSSSSYDNITDVAGFDASRNWTGETSSTSLTRTTDIYGNSNTVQPKTVVGMWLVKAYGTITNVGNVETSDILQAVDNSKVTLAVW